MGCGDAAIGCSLRIHDISTNSVRRLNERISRGMRRCSNMLLHPLPRDAEMQQWAVPSAASMSQGTRDVGFRFVLTLYCIRAMGHRMLVTVFE